MAFNPQSFAAKQRREFNARALVITRNIYTALATRMATEVVYDSRYPAAKKTIEATGSARRSLQVVETKHGAAITGYERVFVFERGHSFPAVPPSLAKQITWAAAKGYNIQRLPLRLRGGWTVLALMSKRGDAPKQISRSVAEFEPEIQKLASDTARKTADGIADIFKGNTTIRINL